MGTRTPRRSCTLPNPAALVLLAGSAWLGGCASDAGPAGAPDRFAIVERQRVPLGGAGALIPLSDAERPPGEAANPGEASGAAPLDIPVIPMGDEKTIARILDEGKNRNQVMNHLSHLSLNIGPRLTGSTNAEKANRWAMDRFAFWGLSNAHLDEWGTIAARFDRGPSSGRAFMTRQTTDREGNPSTEEVELARLDFTTLAWVNGTEGPVRGPVVMMPRTDEEFDAVKDRLAGAWLLIGPEPDGRRGIRGVGGMMRARGSNWADIRKRLADPEAMAAELQKRRAEAEEAAARAAAPDDGISGPWKGTMVGAMSPNGAPVTLTLEKSPDGSVAGTMAIGEYATGEIRDVVMEGQTLSFTRPSRRGGDRRYALTIDGSSMSGEGVTEEGEASYTVKLERAEAEPPPPVPDGPNVEERILMAGPAGFISGSGDRRVWTTSANGWIDMDAGSPGQDIEVNIGQPSFEMLRELVERDASVEAEFELTHLLTPGPIPVYNTVAEIPGTELPDEVVIVSAHLDSWNGPGSTGTIDNGTGSAVTLEAARILMAAGAKPKRTIRFILWTGEEQGLLGSESYVERHKDQLDKISCVLVDDGGTNYEGGIVGTDAMLPMLANATAPVNNVFYSEIDGKYLNVNVRSAGDRMPRGGGSDHASFNAAGVPGFFWDEVGRADYGYGWHTQYDRLDQAIPEYLVQSSTCAAVTAYNLACAPSLLPREAPAAETAPAGN